MTVDGDSAQQTKGCQTGNEEKKGGKRGAELGDSEEGIHVLNVK